ncbi:MAG: hypothetical protein ACRCU6_02255 [Fusobacteriaceae bacterium]|uniref:hypothetical protein n=1 Tax=Cetobacterium sp. TaxID=2071632 RepID=UPI003EE7780E
MFIYLDREKAKEGISLVYFVSESRKNDYETYFEGQALEYEGNNLPHFITYISDKDTIREATEEEKLKRGERGLFENEILKNGKIISYDINTQKIVNNEIIDKTREDYITEGIITLESEKEKARTEREKQLRALDLYDKAVLRGDIKETEEMKQERDKFRKDWLEIPNNYDDINIPIEELYPMPIESIVYFL